MSDKRRVATDALETLGTFIDDKQKRDAIHLAVEPVIAAQKLFPGQDVGLVEGGAGVCDKPLGIVDPFLKGVVHPGQYFWLVVYPRQINSLRHVWTHPDFPEEISNITVEDTIQTSREWLEALAARLNLTYEDIINGAKEFIKGVGYLTVGYEMEDEVNFPEFWTHYQIVTGEKVAKENQGNFFSCYC